MSCRNQANARVLQEGLAPTGHIIGQAREASFNNVHDFLLHQATGESADMIAARKGAFEWGNWLLAAVHADTSPKQEAGKPAGSCIVPFSACQKLYCYQSVYRGAGEEQKVLAGSVQTLMTSVYPATKACYTKNDYCGARAALATMMATGLCSGEQATAHVEVKTKAHAKACRECVRSNSAVAKRHVVVCAASMLIYDGLRRMCLHAGS